MSGMLSIVKARDMTTAKGNTRQNTKDAIAASKTPEDLAQIINDLLNIIEKYEHETHSYVAVGRSNIPCDSVYCPGNRARFVDGR